MSQETYVTINVFGRKPVPVKIGVINKTSGQPGPNVVNAEQELGEYNLPNYSAVWGRLLFEKDPKTKLDTAVLTGEIEFLPWGSPKGKIVEIRYLRNCSSISVEYQKEKKLGVRPDGKIEYPDDQAEIPLKIGFNKFKESTQKELILMLKYHGLNRTNGSRNPDKEHRRTTIETYIASEKVGVVASDIQNRQQAEKIVLEIRNNTQSLEIMGELFDVSTDKSDDYIFNQLIGFSQNPKEFLNILHIEAEKNKNLLYKGLDMGLIIMQSEDIQIMVGGAKDILMTNVAGDTVEERVEFITDNQFNAEYHFALKRLAAQIEIYKEAVLQ